MNPRRDWSDARQKVEAEGRCRVCLRGDRKIDAAHVIGRRHDGPRVEGSTTKVLWVNPDSIVPLCHDDCHADYDAHRLSLLAHLTLDEQIQAVKDAGGIEAARRRIDPLDYTNEIRAARAVQRVNSLGLMEIVEGRDS